MPIDWTKSGLRTAYLVEGLATVFKSFVNVRWCGPKSRTGSGLMAYPTLGPAGSSLETIDRGGQIKMSMFEARLSRCRYDASLGNLKQNVQRISDVTMTVDIGDDDNPTTSLSPGKELRDLVIRGKWKGKHARLTVIDLDDPDQFEVLVEGTWDRNPDKVTDRSFKMTIIAGAVISPIRRWPCWQVPENVPSGWDDSGGSAPRLWPGGGVSLPYRLSPATKGKYLGHAWGGTQRENWIEIVPYGVSSSYNFALVSPQYDLFVVDIVYEADGGDVVSVAQTSGSVIQTFNQLDPAHGPLGTAVKWSNGPNDCHFRTNSNRIFAKVYGGVGAGHGPDYPWLGDNIPGGGMATPDVAGVPAMSELAAIIQTIWSDPLYGISDSGQLHSRALVDLHAYMILNNLHQTMERNCRVPRSLEDEPPFFLDVINDLMRSVPADLALRFDPVANAPRYYFVVRPSGAIGPKHTIVPAMLAQSDTSARSGTPGIVQLADPDGYYANDLKFVETINWPPVTTEDVVADNTLSKTMPNPAPLQVQGRVPSEQGPFGVGQAVEAERRIKYWAHVYYDELVPVFMYTIWEGARPQQVLEATHGPGAMAMGIGEILRYTVPGVLNRPGQIRGLKLDLDRQTVTVKTYHYKEHLRVSGTSVDVPKENDKAEAVAARAEPSLFKSKPIAQTGEVSIDDVPSWIGYWYQPL